MGVNSYLSIGLRIVVIDEYAYVERIAICIASGMDYTAAKKIADSDLPKEEPEAVKRVKALRAKIAADKASKPKSRYEY